MDWNSSDFVSNYILTKMLYKATLCSFFQQGKCLRGPHCSFAHCKDELRDRPNLRKTRLCESFSRGRCAEGDKCAFAHGRCELRSWNKKSTMCKRFKEGRCKRAERCPYAHSIVELERNTSASSESSDVYGGLNGGMETEQSSGSTTTASPMQRTVLPPSLCGLGDDGGCSFWKSSEDIPSTAASPRSAMLTAACSLLCQSDGALSDAEMSTLAAMTGSSGSPGTSSSSVADMSGRSEAHDDVGSDGLLGFSGNTGSQNGQLPGYGGKLQFPEELLVGLEMAKEKCAMSDCTASSPTSPLAGQTLGGAGSMRPSCGLSREAGPHSESDVLSALREGLLEVLSSSTVQDVQAESAAGRRAVGSFAERENSVRKVVVGGERMQRQGVCQTPAAISSNLGDYLQLPNSSPTPRPVKDPRGTAMTASGAPRPAMVDPDAGVAVLAALKQLGCDPGVAAYYCRLLLQDEMDGQVSRSTGGPMSSDQLAAMAQPSGVGLAAGAPPSAAPRSLPPGMGTNGIATQSEEIRRRPVGQPSNISPLNVDATTNVPALYPCDAKSQSKSYAEDKKSVPPVAESKGVDISTLIQDMRAAFLRCQNDAVDGSRASNHHAVEPTVAGAPRERVTKTPLGATQIGTDHSSYMGVSQQQRDLEGVLKRAFSGSEAECRNVSSAAGYGDLPVAPQVTNGVCDRRSAAALPGDAYVDPNVIVSLSRMASLSPQDVATLLSSSLDDSVSARNMESLLQGFSVLKIA